MQITEGDKALAQKFTFGLERQPACRSADEIESVEFDVARQRFTLEALLSANADDTDLCAWARAAQPGDFYPGVVSCECVLRGDLSEADRLAIDRAYAADKASGALDRRREHRMVEAEVDYLRATGQL